MIKNRPLATPRALRLLMLTSSLTLFVLAGCGRDSLQRGASPQDDCNIDADCSGAQVCMQSVCVDPDLDMGTTLDDGIPDPPDLDDEPDLVDPPDMTVEPDFGPPIECVIGDECPGGGDPIAQGGRCFEFSCATGVCEPAEVRFMCAQGFEQEGCECVQARCESHEECNGQGCFNGVCQPCRANDHCGELACDEQSGQCFECVKDLDCNAREICQNAECVPRPECLLDDECDEQELCLNGRCSFSPECELNNDCAEGYECISNRCFEAICRGPQDCDPGELCDAGICVDPPQSVDRCFVATPNQTVSPGQSVRLEAFAVDASGNGIAANFVWMSDNASSVSVSGTNALATSTAGTASVTAALASGMPILCEGAVEFSNIGPPPPMGGLRVVVLDAETGAAVPNADVVINRTATGATNTLGVATFPIQGGKYSVSVFSDDHDFVTVQGVSATDIRIPLNKQSGTGPIAGFKGSFDLSQVSSQGEFNLGLAGASIPGGLVNFDLTTLLGDPFQTDFAIPGQGNVGFPVPGGLTIYGRVFGLRLDIKRTYYVSSPGGARLAWGLAGKIPVTELIALFQNGGVGGIGEALTLLLPLFNRFDHGVKPLQLVPRARVMDTNDVDGDMIFNEMVPDYDNFPSESILPNVRQQLITDIGVSNLPTLTNGPAEVAILVGGTQLESTGFVPLGISATNDEDGDGRPDVRRLTMAPPYGSLVGGRFAVLSIAFRTDAFGAGAAGLEFPDEFSIALWNGQTLPTAIQLGTFPSTATLTEDPTMRAFAVSSPAGPLYRARFVGQDRSWDVWTPGAPGVMGQFNHNFDVPKPPLGREDLYQNANKVLFDSIRTQVQINDLLRPSGLFLYDAALVSTGFSRTRVR